MKKILIINKSFEAGGIQSSLVNMANELQKYYQVDLFIFNPRGPMRERLHENVNILPVSWRFQSLGMSLNMARRTKNPMLFGFRFFAAVWSKLFDNSLPIGLAIKHQNNLGQYDLVIAYHQEQKKHTVTSGFSRVADQCAEAKKKIAWLHFDSDTIDLDKIYNNRYYQKLDQVVCVSQTLAESFAKNNPDFKGKTEFCYNFLDYNSLTEKSNACQNEPFPKNKYICFSACRLTAEKALVRAVHCLVPVFQKQSDLMWYIAGDGPERNAIQTAIREEKLEAQIILLGNLSNPYPYMKNADLLMNVSYHEAAPMVFMEAKALGTPIFATRTSSAEELLGDLPCAFLCENSEQGIHAAFDDLMAHPDRILQAKEALRGYTGSNEKSLQKFAQWLQEE